LAQEWFWLWICRLQHRQFCAVLSVLIEVQWICMVRSHEIVAEFLGTFILAFTIGCNVLSGNGAWGGVSIGSALMVCIYGLAPVSGANFNPAVSVALGLVSTMGLFDFDFGWRKVFIYSMTQCLAAVMAAFVYTALFFNLDSVSLQPGVSFGWINAGLAEFFYTFMLCFVVLNVAVSTSARRGLNQFFGLAIGFVIVAGAYGGGVVSGGCFNPAVALGIHVSSGVSNPFGLLFYAFCQLLGAAAAAGLFRVVRPRDFRSGAAAGGSQRTPKLVAEFLGTFMLVLTVGLNVFGRSAAGAFSIAAALVSMIYALGDVSGAHFNPAVTVAAMGIGRHEPGEVAPYVAAQALGGFSGASACSLIYGGASFPLAIDPAWAKVALAETFFTFVLCLVVLSVACSKQAEDRKDVADCFGLAIGSCVTVGGFAIGGISGGSLNPAVSVGVSTAAALGGRGVGGPLAQAAAYTVFELTGGLLAAGSFEVLHSVLRPKPAQEVPERRDGSGGAADGARRAQAGGVQAWSSRRGVV